MSGTVPHGPPLLGRVRVASNDFFASPTYVAPELALGSEEIGPAVDIYTLGVVSGEDAR